MTQELYKQGKIYKLVSSETDKIYIGSCCQPLHKRFYVHKQGSLRGHNRCYSKKLFELGGEVKIILIENYPCETKYELQKRERYHIEQNSNCVNKNIPTRTLAEYREANKEQIAEYCRKYFHANREMISQKMSVYYKEHKEEIAKRQGIRVICKGCGRLVRNNDLPKHMRSKRCREKTEAILAAQIKTENVSENVSENKTT